MFFPRHRPARTLTQLFELRKERDAQLAEKRRVFGQRALARVKARYDADPGNILYGGARREEETPLAIVDTLYPHLPVPTVRFWVIFNNQLRPLPQVTDLHGQRCSRVAWRWSLAQRRSRPYGIYLPRRKSRV